MAACPYCGGEKRRDPVLCSWCLSQVPPASRSVLERRADRDDVVAQQRQIQLLSALRRGVPLGGLRVVA